ncbi:MAG: PQQ-dependent sugar dehydrogenase, partial [Actinomycetota bacterium]|nr:PQQ-dependent sugar dehydrogenase [Actinomycetota bacterium]
MPRRAVFIAAIALLAACDGGGSSIATVPMTSVPTTGAPTATTGASAPAAPHAPDLTTKVRLQKVAALQQPTAMAVRAGDDAIYVAEKSGRVRRVAQGQTDQPGAVDSQLVLDLSGDVTKGGEQGLLGLTFAPDGSKLYVDYTDTKGDTNVVEYALPGGTNTNTAVATADPATRREILFVHQPYPN